MFAESPFYVLCTATRGLISAIG